MKKDFLRMANSAFQKKLENAKRHKRFNFAKSKYERLYNTIVEEFPESAVNDTDRKMITEYATEVFGDSRHASCLIAHTAFYGRFEEGWIPEAYYKFVLLPKWKNHVLIGQKTISRRFLEPEFMPDIAYKVRDCWVDQNYQPIESKDLRDVFFAGNDHVYVKADTGGSGNDVFRMFDSEFTQTDLSTLGDLAIQRPIRQHDYFDKISKASVATIRVTTIKSKGCPAKRKAAYFRIGAEDDSVVVVDNSIEIAIVDDDGTLGRIGRFSDWRRTEVHSPSGFRFEGQVLPGFRKAQDLCERLHDTIPHLTIIGWDIAIDQDGNPNIIEMNTAQPGIQTYQLLAGPCFKGLGWEDVWKDGLPPVGHATIK